MRSIQSSLGAAGAAVAVLFTLCLAPAHAQQAATAPAPAAAPAANGADRAGMTRPAPDGLYEALGEKPGIARLMDDLVTRAVADPRIGPIFKDTKVQALKDSLTLQVCVLSGGPCVYEGDNMKAAHADFAITKGDFNRLVELLQFAMDAQNIPFTQQNRLLALLAPMHGDIITRR